MDTVEEKVFKKYKMYETLVSDRIHTKQLRSCTMAW